MTDEKASRKNAQVTFPSFTWLRKSMQRETMGETNFESKRLSLGPERNLSVFAFANGPSALVVGVNEKGGVVLGEASSIY